MGYADPFTGNPFPRLEYVLKGIKRTQAAKGMQAKPRLPITPAILRQLFRAWDQSQDPDAPMLKAAACLAFFGFLRTAEFTTPSQRDFDASTHLTLQDVAIDSRQTPSVIRIHIKHS